MQLIYHPLRCSDPSFFDMRVLHSTARIPRPYVGSDAWLSSSFALRQRGILSAAHPPYHDLTRQHQTQAGDD